MLPLAHAGLTTPAVAGPGCNEGLGLARDAENALRNKALFLVAGVACFGKLGKLLE